MRTSFFADTLISGVYFRGGSFFYVPNYPRNIPALEPQSSLLYFGRPFCIIPPQYERGQYTTGPTCWVYIFERRVCGAEPAKADTCGLDNPARYPGARLRGVRSGLADE